MPLPADRATTLPAASRVCDVQPLEGKAMKYYVPMTARRDAIGQLNVALANLRPGEAKSFLFTGHIGCGKSSELNRMAQGWEREYLVLPIRVDAETNIHDVTYTDLYLVAIQHVEAALRQHDIHLDKELRESFEQWLLEITQERQEEVNRSVSLDTEAKLGADAPLLFKLIAKLIARITGSVTDKRTIRQNLSREFTRMQGDTNLLLADGTRKLRQKFPEKKGILLILDGLDKCPKAIGQRLFLDNAAQLQQLQCPIIYTVPISSLYRSQGLGGSFEPPTLIPMVNVYQYDRDQPDLTYDPNGVNSIAELVEYRVEVDAIFQNRQLLTRLAQMSGGHPRFLMQLTRGACTIAQARGHHQVQDEDLTYAANQLQFGFERTLSRRYYQVLAQIACSKDLENLDNTDEGEQIALDLLLTNAVLEYDGGRRWVYPHPLVRRSDLYQRALNDVCH